MPLPLSSQDLLVAIYYGTPIACFVYFGLAFSFTVCTLQTQDSGMNRQRGRRGLMITLILALAATYIAEATDAAVHYAIDSSHDIGQDYVFYLLACTAIFTAQSLALYDTESPAWYPYYPTWFLGLVAEITLFVLSDTWKYPSSMFELVCIIIQSLRAGAFVALPMICLGLRGNISRPYDNADAERQALLSKRLASNTASSDENGYGSIETEDSDTADNTSEAGSEDSWIAREQQSKDAIAKRLKENGNWFTYLNGFMIFLPYVWPYQSKRLQIRALLVGGCLLASNALHVLVPRQMGKMVDSVDAYIKHQPGSSDSVPNVWLPVLGYALLIFVSGGACLGWLRRWLWLPVEQYSYDAISTASHAHLMNLSSDFHDSKTSSDLTQAISGGRSVPNLLETVCFEVVPMFIDLAVAFAFLSTIFGPLMGLILVVEAVIYFYVTTKLIAFRAGKRREYIAIYRKEWNVAQQSLDGWSTASLFNQIKHEEDRYSLAVKEHMASQVSYEMSTQALGAVQGAIMTLGLIGALFLGVWQVSRQGRSIGNLTTLLAYWAQLQSPLQFFSTILRTISYSLMDAERLLELFQTKPTVIDRPNAAPLNLTHGEVEFTNVSFAYDKRKPTLKEVSFSIPAGKTVALVGETGGGKTTILKMIDRFYDVKSGSIKIDDQDIRDVTLQSLRAKIGVVPQDPMLFNDSIMSNLRYARLDATDEEVFEACKAAAVHDKIMSFPDGYSAKVGDRGVKLSGGEKQRVAIARAILKKPELILLDEATSAVDTETEVQIQDGLKVLCRNRTTFIVAHRLSTVMRADRILVVMNGEIVENGSHDELLHKDGKYASLWSKQISVKPNDSRSRSKSPKRDGDLINDLSMTQQTTTLSKVIEEVEPSEISSDTTEVETQIAIEEDKFYGDGGHSRETSHASTTLKPDALEFVPSSAKKETPKPVDKKGKQPEMSQTKPTSGRTFDGATDTDGDGGVLKPIVGNSSTVLQQKLRYVRSQRRQGSKSDPATASQDSVIGSAGNTPAPRRVSAPFVLPLDQEANHGGGGKRGRRFRLKTRVAAQAGLHSTNSGSGSGSGSSFGGERLSADAPEFVPGAAAAVVEAEQVPEKKVVVRFSDEIE